MTLLVLSLLACKGGVSLDGETGLADTAATEPGDPGDPGDPAEPVDADGDGYTAEEDCDDADASTHPGGAEGESPDGVDQDCSGTADDVRVCDGVYTAIQEAVDAAPDGFTVVVCPGTYTENLLIEGRELTLLAAEGPGETTLDGGGAGAVVTVSGARYFALEGFTVTNGLAEHGGGLSAEGSELAISGNVFVGNTATLQGGGFYLSRCQGAVWGNTVEGNTSGEGGGGAVDRGQVELRENSFSGNHAAPSADITWNGAAAGGGGLWVRGASTVLDNTFDANTSDINGAGLYTVDASGLVGGNTFTSNVTSGDGGGAYLNVTSAEVSDNHFEGNTAYDDAGGLRLYISSGSVLRNTLLNNAASDDGGGMKLSHARSTVSGNVFEGNSAGDAGGGFEIDNDNSNTTDNTFTQNRAARGGAINSKDNTARFRIADNTFTGNSATEGGAVRLDNNPYTVTVSRNVFTDNSGTTGAGVLVNLSEFSLEANVIAGSTGDAVAVVGSSGGVWNLTVHDSSGAGLSLTDCVAVEVGNTIFSGGAVGLSASGCEPAAFSYNLLWDNAADTSGSWTLPSGAGVVLADPEFTAADFGDFTLRAGSPAVDAGHPSVKDTDGTRSDIGAHGGPDAL